MSSPEKNAEVNAPSAPPPVGAYPHARRAGDLLFLSGVGPRKPGSEKIPGVTLGPDGEPTSHDIRAQCESCFDNVQAILEAAGSGLDRVVDVLVFLTDMKRDFAGFNEAYRARFEDVRPTRTTIEVGALPTPIAVELKVIATLD